MTKVLVNSQGKPYIVESNKVLLGNTFGTKTITENGTYTASSDNLDGYSSVTVNVSGGGGGKYSLLERISDDSNNEIGTVSGFFIDANDVEYAVVCLDAQYRLAQGQWSSSTGAVTNLPLYYNLTVYSATETATNNTQLILDWCSANNYTSSSCTHCRSKSFLIDGVTFYGQLPNAIELIDIFRRRVDINATDTSASSYSSLIIPTGTNTWSSSQFIANTGWSLSSSGYVYPDPKTSNKFTCPILELPNQ